MCFFPSLNLDFKGVAYRKGLTQFDCGSCPECLRKRSSVWALRSVYECREHADNCMITLTYDNYIFDSNGDIVGEEVSPLSVCKRDVQLFVKRLRKWYSSFSSEEIKYIICAEYGKRTHRAHYHAILFGVRFPDLIPYKTSRRGNLIYQSDRLNRLWNHGICTVDCINVSASVARYCTKYCAKDRSDDTFMLFSHHIGLKGLLADFNGKSYVVDGREYPIPRIVWEHHLYGEFNLLYPGLSNRYVNYNEKSFHDGSFMRSCRSRVKYRRVRDSYPIYRQYLDYWSRKASVFERNKPSLRSRIFLLDDSKYHSYKVAALRCLSRSDSGFPLFVPRSSSTSVLWHYWRDRGFWLNEDGSLTECMPVSASSSFYIFGIRVPDSFALPSSRLYRANDTRFFRFLRNSSTYECFLKNFRIFFENNLDNPFDLC